MFFLFSFLPRGNEKQNNFYRTKTGLSRALSLLSLSLYISSQRLIFAHRITSTHSPSAPATPHAIILLAATRRDITPKMRRAPAIESSAPRSASEAWTIVSRWRWRSCRIETPSSWRRSEK